MAVPSLWSARFQLMSGRLRRSPSTKGAISMLGKALGSVLGERGIRVGVVEPGAVATNMSAPMFDMPDVMKYYIERIALPPHRRSRRIGCDNRVPALGRCELCY